MIKTILVSLQVLMASANPWSEDLLIFQGPSWNAACGSSATFCAEVDLVPSAIGAGTISLPFSADGDLDLLTDQNGQVKYVNSNGHVRLSLDYWDLGAYIEVSGGYYSDYGYMNVAPCYGACADHVIFV